MNDSISTSLLNTVSLKSARAFLYLFLLALSACGGGGGGDSSKSNTWVAGVYKSADNFVARCATPRTGSSFPDTQGTILNENNWLRSWSNDVYLWYDEIQDRNPASYSSTSEYFPLLKTTATTASGNPKDRFHFTFSTDEWVKLSQSGVSAGYGAIWTIISPTPPREIVVAYTEPGSPATSVNLMRGVTVLEVDGVKVVDGTDVDILNAGLFPDGAGELHTFLVQDPGSTASRTVTMTSAEITSQPVQNVKTFSTATGKVGYMVFNDHIATAEQQLIDAVSQLKAENISDLIVDLRYNGGGFLYIASQLGYMIAGQGLTTGKTFEDIEFNDKHPATNPFTGGPLTGTPFHTQSTTGQPLPTLDLPRVFVITGPGTCSASEAIINGLRGVDLEVIQIGSTTCGKPYGFFPTDNCSTTYFTINFVGENEKNFGDYPDGFSPVNTVAAPGVVLDGCSVADDYTHQLGDEAESRLAATLGYRENGGCPIPSGKARAGEKPSLAASDGITPKSVWLENRIMRITP